MTDEATMATMRKPLRLHVAERVATIGDRELVRRASDVWWLLDVWAAYVVEAQGASVGWEEVAQAVTDEGFSRRTAYRYRDLARRAFPDLDLEAVVAAIAEARQGVGFPSEADAPPNLPDHDWSGYSAEEIRAMVAEHPDEWRRMLLVPGGGTLSVDLPELPREGLPAAGGAPSRPQARGARRSTPAGA